MFLGPVLEEFRLSVTKFLKQRALLSNTDPIRKVNNVPGMILLLDGHVAALPVLQHPHHVSHRYGLLERLPYHRLSVMMHQKLLELGRLEIEAATPTIGHSTSLSPCFQDPYNASLTCGGRMSPVT